jgi:MFS superfamily sulfate permease-like transporter
MIVCAHLGRPGGWPDPKYSLVPVAVCLGVLLGQEVGFPGDITSPPARAAVASRTGSTRCTASTPASTTSRCAGPAWPEVIPGLVVYRYDAPLCFANAENFRHRALAAADQSQGPLRWFVLNVEANVEVDFTALEAMEALREDITQRGAVFALARVKQDLMARLEAFGLADKIGTELLFPTLPTAARAYRDRTKEPPPGRQESGAQDHGLTPPSPG